MFYIISTKIMYKTNKLKEVKLVEDFSFNYLNDSKSMNCVHNNIYDSKSMREYYVSY
jgi:hypothetical protein